MVLRMCFYQELQFLIFLAENCYLLHYHNSFLILVWLGGIDKKLLPCLEDFGC